MTTEEIEFYLWCVANKPWGVPLRLWLWACKFKVDRPWPEDDDDVGGPLSDV